MSPTCKQARFPEIAWFEFVDADDQVPQDGAARPPVAVPIVIDVGEFLGPENGERRGPADAWG